MGALNPEAPLVVTGASGFLGRAIVTAALDAGHAVRAVVRDTARLHEASWRNDPRVALVTADLAVPQARPALDAALAGAGAVIHAAAALGGDDASQARDTVGPTASLLAAMAAQPAPPRLVLISSLAVYNYASLPGGACLDETVPLEPEPQRRDAYARAKLAQEALAVATAQRDGLMVRVLRPGAIIGPGRLRTARLGLAFGPLLLMPGGMATVPAITVADCGTVAVLAAGSALAASDVPPAQGRGHFEAINVIDPGSLDQAALAAAIAPSGWPRRVVRLPLAVARAPAQAVGLGSLLLPTLATRLPAILRPESFDARFKSLRYSTARLEDRLGWRPSRPFVEAVSALAGGSPARHSTL